ncbi:hypothetical protein KQX54_005473 [Cotesia glomerata]|uniref:Uncharacterized protein n=1 Tax=Cotesia glomerata TaxID=32391 RepID=A0AAV7I726_COTGL|nr:hypothetical protein KQX54_005473 [Cotesia glomerata]
MKEASNNERISQYSRTKKLVRARELVTIHSERLQIPFQSRNGIFKRDHPTRVLDVAIEQMSKAGCWMAWPAKSSPLGFVRYLGHSRLQMNLVSGSNERASRKVQHRGD